MAISTIRLQSLKSDSNLHKKTAFSTIWQQFLQSDCNLHNRTAICTIRGLGHVYVSCGTFAISAIRLQSQQSDCNLTNKTAISPIRLQSPQLNCNLHNQTAMQEDWSLIAEIAVWLLRLQKFRNLLIHAPAPIKDSGILFYSDCWDCSLIAEIAVWFWRWVKIGGPEIEASHWLKAQNQGLSLDERTGFKKFKALAFRSEISLIP